MSDAIRALKGAIDRCGQGRILQGELSRLALAVEREMEELRAPGGMTPEARAHELGLLRESDGLLNQREVFLLEEINRLETALAAGEAAAPPTEEMLILWDFVHNLTKALGYDVASIKDFTPERIVNEVVGQIESLKTELETISAASEAAALREAAEIKFDEPAGCTTSVRSRLSKAAKDAILALITPAQAAALEKVIQSAKRDWPAGKGGWKVDFGFLQSLKKNIPQWDSSEEEIEEILLAATRMLRALPMDVMNKLDLQAIANELSIPLGESIAEKILPAIRQLKTALAAGEAAALREIVIEMRNIDENLQPTLKEHDAATLYWADRIEALITPHRHSL